MRFIDKTISSNFGVKKTFTPLNFVAIANRLDRVKPYKLPRVMLSQDYRKKHTWVGQMQFLSAH